MNGFRTERLKRLSPVIAICLITPILIATASAGTRDDAISVVDMDRLQWKDYQAAQGAASVNSDYVPDRSDVETNRTLFVCALRRRQGRLAPGRQVDDDWLWQVRRSPWGT